MPGKQRALARALRAAVVEFEIDHLGVTAEAHDYNPALLEALEATSVPRWPEHDSLCGSVR